MACWKMEKGDKNTTISSGNNFIGEFGKVAIVTQTCKENKTKQSLSLLSERNGLYSK